MVTQRIRASREAALVEDTQTRAAQEQRAALADLQHIPGVGPSIALDLWNLGMRSVVELRGQDPEALYDRLCAQIGADIDRCVLYTFRGAVYFASTERHDPELLKWWNWSDKKLAARHADRPGQPKGA